MNGLALHTYWHSSAAYRVRIALNLKECEYESVPVHLVRDEQHAETFLAINPAGLVPVLRDGERVIRQSLAIVEYLEETRPWPPLLPVDPFDRAWVRALALDIACDVHPLNNRRVRQYLTGELGAAEEERDAWLVHWIALGFEAIEKILSSDPRCGRYCFGDTPGLADIALVPQVLNANVAGCDMEPFPTLRRINEACLELPAFRAAAPDAQSDKEDE